jgi:hypothetical protein
MPVQLSVSKVSPARWHWYWVWALRIHLDRVSVWVLAGIDQHEVWLQDLSWQ